MLANLSGDNIFLNFYPELFSTTLPIAGLSRDQYAFRVDPMTFDPQTYTMSTIDCQVYDTQVSPILMNPSKPMLISEVQYYPGQVSVASSKTTAAPTTQKLFQVKVVFNVTFFGRY